MMKKISVFSLAILFASVASAQISKGSLFLGGQISGYKKETEFGMNNNQESKGFTFSPAIGTAIKQNLILGVDFTYGSSESEFSGNTQQDNKSIGGGVFVRKYVPLGKRFYFFGQARAGYLNNDSEQTQGNVKTVNESNRIDLSLYPGVSFALTKAFHIEAGFNNLALISYEKGESIQTGPFSQPVVNENSSLGFSTNVGASNITFGFRFIIPR